MDTFLECFGQAYSRRLRQRLKSVLIPCYARQNRNDRRYITFGQAYQSFLDGGLQGVSSSRSGSTCILLKHGALHRIVWILALEPKNMLHVVESKGASACPCTRLGKFLVQMLERNVIVR